MCVEIWMDGCRIQSIGQMRAKLGRDPVWADGFDPINPSVIGDEFCLCPIDVEATASLMGCICEFDGVDYLFIPQPPEDAR